MFDVQWSLYISAFVAGVVTFLAPCTLPLIPAFLGVISGVDISSIPENNSRFSKKIIINACAYVLGFSLVFIVLGSIISVAIQVLVLKSLIQKIGGVFLIILGLSMGGWLQAGFLSRFNFISKNIKPAGFINSFLLGCLLDRKSVV